VVGTLTLMLIPSALLLSGKYENHHVLVGGIEGARPLMFSQYAFGATPQHPAFGWVLDKILEVGDDLLMNPFMTVKDRLRRVLSSTGPVVWTDTIMEYFALSASVQGQDPQSPQLLHLGGQNMNSKIFPIAGFGCGQFHSNSPDCNSVIEDVNIRHNFGGSTYFSSKRWQGKETE